MRKTEDTEAGPSELERASEASEQMKNIKQEVDADFMPSGAKHRMSILERSIELPLTAERFLASVQERVRHTGMSAIHAFRSLITSLSNENLDRLETELAKRAAKQLDHWRRSRRQDRECSPSGNR